MARVTVMVSISLPPAMAAELDALCKKEHRTRSELLREALRRYSNLQDKPVHTNLEFGVVS